MDKARLIDTMSQLRTGRKPRVETTMRLARALGVKPSFLMDLD